MAHEGPVVKFNGNEQIIDPDTLPILDKQVVNFLEISDYLSKVLSMSDLISEILEFLDSEE